MRVTFDYLPEFERRAKDLAKKYKSFKSDYSTFLDELEANPFGGEPLGHHTYKNRMTIVSKGKGKSGGARVITNTADVILKERKGKLTLMYIYDKSERSSVSDAFLLHLREKLMP